MFAHIPGENPLSSPRRFLWCGTWGYRFNERYAQYTSHYVRARHYSSLQGMWSTVDPLYPRERAYGYVENRVTVGIDPSGLGPVSLTFAIAMAAVVECAGLATLFELFAHQLYRPNDKKGHCVANCVISRFNFPCALAATVLTECIPGGDSSLDDIKANIVGLGCGSSQLSNPATLFPPLLLTNCDNCCGVVYGGPKIF